MASIVYQTPGVYVEEVPSGARPIQAVGTRTAGFVGVAPNPARYVNEAVAVNNWAEFVRRFVSPPPEVLKQAADDQKALEDHKKSVRRRAVDTFSEEYKKKLKVLVDADAMAQVALTAHIQDVGKKEGDLKEEDKTKLEALEEAASNSSANLAAHIISASKEDTLNEKYMNELKTLVQKADNDQVEVKNHIIEIGKKEGKLDEAGKTERTRLVVEASRTSIDLKNHVKSASDVSTLNEDYQKKLKAFMDADAMAQATLTAHIMEVGNNVDKLDKDEKTEREKREKAVSQSINALDAHIIKAGKDETLSAEHIKELEHLKATSEESSIAANQKFPATNLSLAVYGFLLNGGNRCYVVNVGSKDAPITSGASGGAPVGLDVLEQIDEVAIVAAPGYTSKEAYTAVRDHCDKMKDRVGILDGPPDMDDEAMKQLSGETVKNPSWTRPDPSERGHVTLYVPWIEVSNPASGSNNKEPKTIPVPPSGHIAGVWARSDATRGVHKAPANEIVQGALGLAKQVTHEEQGQLNATGVNVIRFFPNEGYLVWGARTLTKDAAFRYLNVRRLFNMIEESIKDSTRWIVFEPNDRPLWQAVRRDVTGFLMGFWRDGALMGKTPEEAFYVKCDEETNPIESIREGKVIIEVGLAPVYPAEFVIFRISQYEAGTEVENKS